MAVATKYEFEIFRGPVRIFAARADSPRLVVPARWRFNGTPRSLVPGEYRWYVWPVVSGKRETPAVVQAKLLVT